MADPNRHRGIDRHTGTHLREIVMSAAFPRRMVHLDFHTSPHIPDVGRDFDAERFAETIADARIDSVTLFAKCHHGQLYYDTDRSERHPSLPKGLDLLGEQIEALHRRDIRAPIYLSILCDEYAAAEHPEWVAVEPDGAKLAGGGVLAPRWQILDMSSPYQEYFAEQLAEVLERFSPSDGIFLDICFDQVSVSKWAVDGMRRRGYDPLEADDRRRYASEVSLAYMERFKKMIDQAQGDGEPAYIWFNSRPKTNLQNEKKFLRHVEIESLPTGGWGYAYFPYVSRFVRPNGLPTLSHTGRFHRSWGDFGGLKPEAALLYECCLMLSQGVTCGVGDQLHPRGTLDSAAYDRIGKVYRYIESCEPWVDSGTIASQIGVIVDPGLGDSPGPAGLGIVRLLQELQHQFDLVAPSAKLGSYDLVIVPETTPVDDRLREKLSGYLAGRGALIISGDAALDANGKPILSELGIRAHGPSPYESTYLRVADSVGDAMPDLDHVMYEPGFRMTPARGSHVLCHIVEPYFDRTWEHFCSHAQTPPDTVSDYAAAVQKGNAITFAVPVFSAYGRHASEAYRQLFRACVERLLPQPLVRADGPAHLETSVVRKGRRTVVHLISFTAVRKAEGLDIVEDPFPLVNLPLAIRHDKQPRRVVIAPAGEDIPFTYQDGYVRVSVTSLTGHTMAVVE